jgi:hypothetical protein
VSIHEAHVDPVIFQFCLVAGECEVPLAQIMAMQLSLPFEEVEGYPSVPSSIKFK